jgi:hypothetical protein
MMPEEVPTPPPWRVRAKDHRLGEHLFLIIVYYHTS